MVGNWVIATDEGNKVVMVDGRTRRQGARDLRRPFIDNVKAFAYFPIAVAQNVDDFTDAAISMRFRLRVQGEPERQVVSAADGVVGENGATWSSAQPATSSLMLRNVAAQHTDRVLDDWIERGQGILHSAR